MDNFAQPSKYACLPDRRPHPWVIVLAGGEGQRMCQAVQTWLGQPRPKQYCAFVGTRSMLRHTLDRAVGLTDSDRIVTVIGGGHRRFFSEPSDCGMPGRILVALAGHFDERMILLGAIPTCAERDYGWIGCGAASSGRCLDPAQAPMEISEFHEKPSPGDAQNFLRRGYLWNTLVIAVKGSALWALGRRFLPEMMRPFEELRRTLETIYGGADGWGKVQSITVSLLHAYEKLEPVDLSRDLLQRAVEYMLVAPLDGVQWSDWGRPERVRESLACLGKRTHMPIAG